MQNEITLEQLAKRLKLSFIGDANLKITGVEDLAQITDSYPANKIIFYEQPPIKIKEGIHSCAFLLPQGSTKDVSALLATPHEIRAAFASLLKFFQPPIVTDFIPSDNPKYPLAHVDARAEVAENATVLPGATVMAYAHVDANCVIHPNAVVSNHAVIKKNTIVYSNAVIYHYCKIGEDNIIHSGAIIGADGFGFFDLSDGRRIKIPQIGNVILGNHVEVGASSTIDRATIGSTTVGSFTKIDNQVHIAHNCQIGSYVYLAGNVAIAGSSILEDGVFLAGSVSVADHVRIGKGSIALGMTGIPHDLGLEETKGKKIYLGIPARPAKEAHRIHHALGELPKLVKQARREKTNKRITNE